MTRAFALALAIGLALAPSELCAPAYAQPAAAQPAPVAKQDRREKIKQRIRALRAYTLTEQLDLDEATAAKLFPALSKYDDEFDRLLVARAELQKKLEGAGAIKDAKEIDKLIDEAVANQKAIWDTEDKRLAQLRKILTPAQTARILVVLPAMERKIQNQLRRAAEQQNAPQTTPKQRPAAGGELTDPYETRDNLKDPFARPRTGPAPDPKSAPAKKATKCDPFASPSACRK